MRAIQLFLFLVALLGGTCLPPLSAQTTCGPEVVADPSGFSGTVFFNYGSAARANSQKYASAVAVGQTFVGYIDGLMNNSTLGFYSRFLLPPFGLKLTATQGDLLDRIQLSWEIDALGPVSSEGFNIYRDGIFLANVGSNIRTYNDFNVIAGVAYNYEVRGLNVYGEGSPGKAIGFQIPNGTVTGWVQTASGQPVPDVLVALTPLQGFSANFEPTHGAFAMAETGTNPFLPPAGNDWTLTFWIKTGSAAANAGLLQFSPFSLHVRALASAGGHEGVEVATSVAGAPFLSAQFPDATKNGWHHVALTYDGAGGQGRLYVDGVLSALAPMNQLPSADDLNLGSRTGMGGWTGCLDELRIYHRRLDELDFGEVMMGTASSLTPNLTHYWKMDEERGTKSFDIIKRHKLYFCDATFKLDRPNVRTMGKTNGQGYYRIESASYGTGTTFLAEPMKDFYMYRSLKFTRNEGDYATLPNFSVTPKATLELWANSAGPDGDQCLVSKRWPGNDFRLLLRQNGLTSDVVFYLNGQEKNFGALGMGYQHLAFTMERTGNQLLVTGYKNGVSLGMHPFSGVTGDWSDPAETWMLGARPSGMTRADHFGGLLDEVALYDSTLSAAKILSHFQAPRNAQEKGLRAYFALDEGNGNRLNNAGSVLLVSGTNFGAEWSAFAARQLTTPHIFTPVTRQVTLNPSVTSVDQVDFVDRSTVPVSGYVRYKNTDCFAKNVEILVNGASFTPRIFTDSTGKFTIDFDPGTTATLTPKFEDHVFVPAFWDVTNVVNPIAGILFNDITTRKVKGRVAGGLCKKSVIKAPPGMGQGTVCVVKVRSTDGCLQREIILDNQEGNYEFLELPPVENMTVAVTEHSDPLIKTAFQVQGGSTVNLTKRDTMVDFIYFAPPEVEVVSGLDPVSPSCNLVVLDQGEIKELTIKVKEQYVPILPSDNGVCYLDTAGIRIINGLADIAFDTAMSGGQLKYKFTVGLPNPSPPYLKTLQIIGTSLAGREGSLTRQAIVTGIRNKENTFTTMMPEFPTIILRDPPGDESSAFIEKDEKICKKTVIESEVETGAGATLKVETAPEVNIVLAPLGIGFIEKIDADVLLNTEAEVTYKRVANNAFETCVSFNNKISTSSGDLIVGGERGADLYVGEAINLIFGFADKVDFDPMACAASVQVVLNVQPGDFATTFVYSEFHIRNNVMRYLDALAADPNATPDDVARYTASKNKWQAILDKNVALKKSSKFIRNVSFDAGVEYEYSETSDTTSNDEVSNGVNSDFSISTGFGFKIKGVGFEGDVKLINKTSNQFKDENSKAVGIKTGYKLADNDPGDAFTVDVSMDTMYHTPVFTLKAGQSSCPWEPGSANREGPNLALSPGSQFTAINVPANEPAVFKMTLGNLSASNEDWTYGFTAVAAKNPHGAIIRLNGQYLNNNTIKYIVPYGTSIPITLTVERGPIEYDYKDLVVALVSECEMERNFALSLPLDGDPKFFSALKLSAHFIRPCSEVNINVPEQEWVVLNNEPLQPGTLRRITTSGYDTSEVNFQLVRVQYRRSNGDGAWLNIPGISDRYNPNWSGFAALPNPKPPVLQPGFTQFFWETAGLSDGPYEIRAVAVCDGTASDKPGYSQTIKGRIDREPPSLVGVPQPSDGVLNVGDEISFTFNQPVNCDSLKKDFIGLKRNVGLYDATTNTLIDAAVTCYENKIVFNPTFDNKFFENHLLRAELRGIQDLIGNKTGAIDWEFVVDRNELAWLTDSMGLTKYEGEYKVGTAAIHNRGGYPVEFKITGAPAWVRVVPSAGTLVANQILPIRFEVDSSLAFGRWSDTIMLRTEGGQNLFFMGGDEPLPIGVRVVCRPPDWKVNPGLFENSMNMVLKLNVQGQFSTDEEDIVAAFVNDELRGRANVRYVPQLNAYLAYLTVYGNPDDQLDPVRLELWDASACLRYGSVVETFTFQPDNVIGIPNNPQLIHTSGLVLREVPFGFGWNWLSFNLAFPDPSLNAALASLQHPQNDLMKSQTAFSTYSGSWLGSLTNLNNTAMYIYRADVPDTLKMLGNLVDPATTPIPVVAGWNWIGYVPSYSLPVNAALGSLPSQTGDLIKSQIGFAQYINPTFGWIGNLQYMSPPNGYQIKVATPGTLTYPPPSANKSLGHSVIEDPTNLPTHQPTNFWSVNPAQYEHSMTLIGMLKVNGQNATTATMELGVFAGTEVRGSAVAIYIAPLQAYQFFLTTYSNAGGEQLKFKLFDSASGAVQDLAETMWFVSNLHQGSIESPVPFSLKTSGLAEVAAEQSFDVQPNPFSDETLLRFALPKAEEVTVSVSDMNGRQVALLRSEARAGLNTVTWDGTSDAGLRLGSGVYFVRLNTEGGSVTRKVVLQR